MGGTERARTATMMGMIDREDEGEALRNGLGDRNECEVCLAVLAGETGKVMNEVTYCREGKGGTDAKNDRIALEIFS